jgi:zinc protease
MRLALAFVATLALAGPALSQGATPAAPSAPATPTVPIVRIAPNLEQFALPNGVRLIVIPDRRVPVVTHMVWYGVGSADEPRGQSGIAHFLEHMMFKGTPTFPAGQFSRQLAEIGGQENAFTSYDYTAYFQRAAKEHLPLLMRYEADRMKNLVIRDADVIPERDVVLEERKQRTDSSPGAILGEAMDAALYQNHPYGLPIIGWDHEIRTLDRPVLQAFYERFYTPSNAIVIIAGDVEPAAVHALATEIYGAVANRASVNRVRAKEPEPRAARRVQYADARVQQPSWSRAYLAPSYATAKEGEAEALDILSDILGGATGRMNRVLVRERGLASSASTGYWGSALDYGRFSVSATPRQGVTFDQIESAVEELLADVVRNGVTQAEIDRARTGMLATSIFSQDSQAQLARIFGFGLLTGSTVEQIQNWPARMMEVTPARVQAAARAVLDVRRSVTGTLVRAEGNRS